MCVHTHTELYETIGARPPAARALQAWPGQGRELPSEPLTVFDQPRERPRPRGFRVFPTLHNPFFISNTKNS
eukprot:SAG31_NODE_224_length_19856_cov_33.632890_8_plen_72_part_00